MFRSILKLPIYTFLLSIFFAGTIQANLEVKYPNLDGIGGESIGYRTLQLALKKSNQDFTLKVHGPSLTQKRAQRYVKKGVLTVFDAGYDLTLEKDFDPIYLPIDRGILGWRLFIIHKENKSKIASIKTLKDLQQYSAGQGHGWGDIKILENAGLRVVKASRIPKLITMIDQKRIDIFPLGANEVYSFLDKYDNSNLIVDDKLVLVYPFGRFFYVNKGNTALAKAIHQGMEKALADGSLQKLLEGHKYFKDAFNKANLKTRVKIDIETPNLSEDFKKIDDKWWFRP